ncbi:MAG: hypothetical protein NUW24_03870 [Anaerolineae bacterium]|jgi:hypothetical protein|nr:hypothetical protein [Anaerolineae bacterium]MDH7473093.1 hypothetical protein [Anaerolineae bacterium]
MSILRPLFRKWGSFRQAGGIRTTVALLILLIALRADAVPPASYFSQQVNYLVAGRHFDLVLWEATAGLDLVAQTAASPQAYLTEAQRKDLVTDYLDRVQRIRELEWQLNQVYSAQQGEAAERAAQPILAELHQLRQMQDRQATLVENIVAEQVEAVLIAEGLGQQGYLWPPVKFRFEPLPLALIISPRDEIRVQEEVHLNPGVPLEEWAAIEDRVDAAFNVSSLITAIGGLSTYPAMVYETSSVNWLMDAVAHEWTHDYLVFHPLGWNYDASPELRTMNETVASLVGEEVSQLVVARYYPEFVLPPPSPPTEEKAEPDEARFDFAQEMRAIRLRVQELLDAGQIEEAEAYMEERRQFLVSQGYYIRKLNQAYFAFHGSYATSPSSGASEEVNPIGLQLTRLRQQTGSLRAFLHTVAPMNSYQDLLRELTSE